MFASVRLVQPVAQQQYLVGQMLHILQTIECINICVQAPNIHPLSGLLPLATPTIYCLFYCCGRSNHRLFLLFSQVGEIRSACCASVDLSAWCGSLLSQIIVLVERNYTKTSFRTSFHNPDNLRMPPLHFGLLSASAAVRIIIYSIRAYWCCGRSKSCTTFTGEKVVIGTSTNMVFHFAIAPFHKPGNSCARSSLPPLDFDEIKPVFGSV